MLDTDIKKGMTIINRITRESWYIAQVDKDNNQAIIVADWEGVCLVNIKNIDVDYILPC